MNTTCLDPQSKSPNLIAVDFDPFAGDKHRSVKIPAQLSPGISASKASVAIESASPRTPSAKNIVSFNFKSVDFDPFTKGEILLTAPATESQKEIWLAVQMSEQANLACLLSQSLRLQGQLNLPALQQAFQQLVIRHESLRTTFSGDGSIILITKSIDLPFLVIDLSGLDLQDQSQQVAEYTKQSINEPFNIQNGLLFSIKILKLDEQNHLVIFTIHHIVCDGWSFGTIMSEIAELYSALNKGIGHNLEQPECFSEYAFLEQNKIDSLEAVKTEEYWLQKFAKLPPVIDLPADYQRPLVRTFNSACENYTLPASLVAKLKQLGIKNGCSLTTTLLVAFEVFLFKLTGQTELVVGVPTSGQTTTGKYNLVGHCVNFLPLYSNVRTGIKFSEYLKARNSEILDDYDHQEFTFGSLLQKLSIPRDASRIPLITAVFNIDLDSGSQNNFDQLNVEASLNRGSFSTFEFFLNGASTANGQIELDCQYNTNLFNGDTIQRRLSEFASLLTHIVEQEDQPISQLSLLSTAAAQQLLVEWNQTQVDYPQDQCIHQLFEEQVAINGEAIALIFQKEQLTYAELNQRANHLANYLLSLGVKPDELVGIAIERSIETIVGILGILKAGAAYLPIDLAYPAERVAFMLENADVSVLLTKQDLVEKLPLHQLQILCLDTDWPKISAVSFINPPNSARPDNLAYVMYTSGSTGLPKGVCVPHQGVVRLVKSAQYTDFDNKQVFLQLAPISFDAATFEIWGSLLNGAKLVLFPSDKPSLTELGQIIRQQQITTLWLTAGLFHLMVDERLEDLRPIQNLIAGGDTLSLPHVQKVLSTLNCRLVNGYGPTENTTFTCCHLISADSLSTSVPIGRPIANTQVYILDVLLQPVPIGIPGELYIGGDGLACGYLKLPELTAEKFIPNPFSGSAKLYKTGDLARYQPNGDIEFLGRIDNQVKIRGFRLELGEIEAALIQHPGLREVVVIDREDRPGDKRLVAYQVTEQSINLPTEQELRTFLRSKLPDYMIPAAFMTIDNLPLTLNGKVDRRALPIPEYQRQDAESLAPRDDIEVQLTAIWQRLLGVQNISIQDNFFELGGHSLIAVRLFAEIEKIWEQNLPLATLFQQQTIEKLAGVLRQEEWSASWSSLVLIQAGEEKPPLFCIHPVGGNILEYYTLANYLGQDRPIYGLQSQGLDGKQEPLRSIENMASHYIREMQTVQPHGPYFLTGYSFGGLVAFEIAQQLWAAGEEIGLLALLDSSAPNLPNYRPSFTQSLGIHFSNLCQLTFKERSSYILDRIAYRFSSKDGEDFLAKSLYKLEDLTPQLLNVLNCNIQAGENYAAKKYSGKIVLFRCQVQDLEHYLHPEFGWPDLVDEGVDIHSIPGPHFRMLKEPRIQFLAAELKLCIQKISMVLDSTH